MKRSLFALLICIIPSVGAATESAVQITRTKNASVSEWQILDENIIPLISGNDYPEKKILWLFLLRPIKDISCLFPFE